MYNYEGEKLLDKIYKDLYNSKSVQHTRRNNDRREESRWICQITQTDGR